MKHITTELQENAFSYLMMTIGWIFLFSGSALCIPFFLIFFVTRFR